jgi:hypothetical protein
MITCGYSSGAQGSIVMGSQSYFVRGRDVRTHRYRIIVAGGLGEVGREAFADLLIEPNGTNTVLTGDLDQAALYGALNRILALGLELVELSRITNQQD